MQQWFHTAYNAVKIKLLVHPRQLFFSLAIFPVALFVVYIRLYYLYVCVYINTISLPTSLLLHVYTIINNHSSGSIFVHIHGHFLKELS